MLKLKLQMGKDLMQLVSKTIGVLQRPGLCDVQFADPMPWVRSTVGW